jgi:hypothetical protein
MIPRNPAAPSLCPINMRRGRERLEETQRASLLRTRDIQASVDTSRLTTFWSCKTFQLFGRRPVTAVTARSIKRARAMGFSRREGRAFSSMYEGRKRVELAAEIDKAMAAGCYSG